MWTLKHHLRSKSAFPVSLPRIAQGGERLDDAARLDGALNMSLVLTGTVDDAHMRVARTELVDYAFKEGHSDVARSLFEAGLAEDARWRRLRNGSAALLQRVPQGHVALVDLLLKTKNTIISIITISTIIATITIITIITYNRQPNEALRMPRKAMLKLRAVDSRCRQGQCLAAQHAPPHGLRNGHADVVDLLLKAGADIDKQNRDGASSLHLASEKGHADIVARRIQMPTA